jgi:anti-sigma-K factor RskA
VGEGARWRVATVVALVVAVAALAVAIAALNKPHPTGVPAAAKTEIEKLSREVAAVKEQAEKQHASSTTASSSK